MISFDSEKELEDALYEKLQGGYNPITDTRFLHVLRQVRLEGYGIVDLMTVQLYKEPGCPVPHMEITLIELKNTKIKHDHVNQIARYRTAIERVFEQGYLDGYEIEISCLLVGMKTFPDDTDLVYTIQSSEWLSVYEVMLSFDKGIEFREVSGWKSSSENLEEIGNYIESIINDEDDEDGQS